MQLVSIPQQPGSHFQVRYSRDPILEWSHFLVYRTHSQAPLSSALQHTQHSNQLHPFSRVKKLRPGKLRYHLYSDRASQRAEQDSPPTSFSSHNSWQAPLSLQSQTVLTWSVLNDSGPWDGEAAFRQQIKGLPVLAASL